MLGMRHRDRRLGLAHDLAGSPRVSRTGFFRYVTPGLVLSSLSAQ